MARIARGTGLNSPQVDATGRVDVLAARLLKAAVDGSSDIYLRALYHQYQPLVDAAIKDSLSGFNCSKVLRQLGLAHPGQAKARADRPRVRMVKDRPDKPRPAKVYTAEFVDGGKAA